MLDIGWSEMLVIGIVMILVVGPKDLPRMLRTFGRSVTKLRSMAGEFRSQFDEALKEAELDDVRKTFDGARKMNPARELRDAMNPLKKAGDDIRADINRAMHGKSGDDATLAKKDPAAPSPTTEPAKPSINSAAKSGATAASAAAASPAAAAKPATTAAKTTNGAASASAASGASATARTPKAATRSTPTAPKPAKAAAKGSAGGKPASKPAGAVKAAPKKTGPTRKAAGGAKKTGDA